MQASGRWIVERKAKWRGISSASILSATDDKISAEWDAKTLPGLMASDEESLDFMWTQFIESAVACVRTHLSDETWMILFHKHFSTEIHAWVNQTGDLE